MTSSRSASLMASVFLTLAIALPAAAQGKGNGHGKPPAAPPPTTTNLPASVTGGTAPTVPFAWMDDASLMAPRTVWLGVSMVQWHGGGANEVVVPVVDASIGLTPRVQVGASIPRVAVGLGTTFVNAKIGIVNNDTHGVKLAVGPTVEILNEASAPAGQSRVQWGLPVSVEFDRQAGRFYGSSGYFSPGVRYAGVGIGKSLSNRLDLSMSFSHAWTSEATAAAATPGIAGPHRNDLSGGASFDLTPNIAVFGSIGRTIATAAEHGAGTTLTIGVSASAGPLVFTK